MLNVFKFGIYKPTSISLIFKNIRQFFRNIKYAWQRCTRGYCDWDVWELNTFYTELIRDTLRHLANTSSGYPGRDDIDTPEKWSNWLNETAQLFDNSIERSFNDYQVYKNKYEDEYYKTLSNFTTEELPNGMYKLAKNDTFEEKELTNKYFDEELNIYNLRDNDKNKALDRLKEHWWDLWD